MSKLDYLKKYGFSGGGRNDGDADEARGRKKKKKKKKKRKRKEKDGSFGGVAKIKIMDEDEWIGERTAEAEDKWNAFTRGGDADDGPTVVSNNGHLLSTNGLNDAIVADSPKPRGNRWREVGRRGEAAQQVEEGRIKSRERHDTPENSDDNAMINDSVPHSDRRRRRRRYDSSDDDGDAPRHRERHDTDDSDGNDDDMPTNHRRRQRQRHDSSESCDDVGPVESDSLAAAPPSSRRRARHDSSDDDDDNDAVVELGETKKETRRTGRMTREEFQESMKRQQKEESERLARLESAGVSGRRQATVYRDSEGRKVKNMSEFMRKELAKRGELPPEQRALEEYDWRMGKVQKEEAAQLRQRRKRAKNMALNRFKDDPELADLQRNRERADDPMLAYVRKRRRAKVREEGKATMKQKPAYVGPPGPPNRYGIKPGYRWDGTDRGNGFEMKLLATTQSRNARRQSNHMRGLRGM